MPRVRDACLAALLWAAYCAGAAAADLPKQGTFNNTFYGYGTWKGYSVGKTRFINSFEEDGFSVGSGIANNISEHCFGTGERKDETRSGRAYCIWTDADGDQIVTDNVNGPWPKDAKDFTGVATFTTGTGKYAGISGDVKYTCHNGIFRAPTDNTFFAYCTGEGNYKLP